MSEREAGHPAESADGIEAQAEHFDVVIIGGGLVGASLACALAPLMERHSEACSPQAPLRVAVVEANELSSAADMPRFQPSFDARASAIAAGSRQRFTAFGLWEAMQEHATPIRTIHVSERGHLGATRMRAEEIGVPALGHVIPNAWMGQVLHRRLAELSLAWYCPARVAEIVVTADGHHLMLEDGRQLVAGLTVLADGGRSGLKERLGIHSAAQSYEQHALIATVEMSQPHQGVAYERFTSEGPMALLPLAGRRMELVWTREPDDAEHLMTLPDSDFLTALQRAFGERAGRFRRVGQRHTYPLSLVRASEGTRPGLAVLGNAAHSLHPVAGQGFNLALRGVTDLVAAIEAGQARGEPAGASSVLSDFETRRSDDRDNVVLFSDGLIRLFGVDSRWLGHARAAGLIGLNLISPLKRLLARRSMGIER
ncbi:MULTISPECIES: 2-octaprenyl-6-methoxyphenyl hydroxylase [Cobetia]|uniref:2-octaprenyl-6-methoxyphenyl hydroxylase n=1 Tax=Cobetia crustatorum TaxID=553385 RepID=A0A558HSB8_9GAMM|nr:MULTISPECIES: 2-octaprenyl-6-methoxyphenyl hydroxylase [Cobetia]TVU71978.1 2-octaprenyl-6-methoxyphenyl hydroxylase [Cobetia crustatorum]